MQTAALLAFKASDNGKGLETWVAGRNPCTDGWAGVCCGAGGWHYTGPLDYSPTCLASTGPFVTGLQLNGANSDGSTSAVYGLTGDIASLGPSGPLGGGLATLDLYSYYTTSGVGKLAAWFVLDPVVPDSNTKNVKQQKPLLPVT